MTAHPPGNKLMSEYLNRTKRTCGLTMQFLDISLAEPERPLI